MAARRRRRPAAHLAQHRLRDLSCGRLARVAPATAREEQRQPTRRHLRSTLPRRASCAGSRGAVQRQTDRRRRSLTRSEACAPPSPEIGGGAISPSSQIVRPAHHRSLTAQSDSHSGRGSFDCTKQITRLPISAALRAWVAKMSSSRRSRDGSIASARDMNDGGRSSVLNVVSWALRGRSNLQPDVQRGFLGGGIERYGLIRAKGGSLRAVGDRWT